MKLCIVLGTRPEIIKLSPVIRELESRKANYFIIHTNQHYSSNMDAVFFSELELPLPKYSLGTTGETDPTAMAAKMKERIIPVLQSENPDVVIVQGDTNSTLAGTLAASALGIKVAHVEAGLRSYDQSMPEEYNRIVTDHKSSFLFPPTSKQMAILLEEGICDAIITITGNTIVDAVRENLALAKKSLTNAPSGPYILLTMHRPSNVDQKEMLEKMIANMETLSEELEMPVVFPVHPRTKKNLDKFRISLDPKIFNAQAPVGYLEMLQLMQSANLIVTDSGGIQEEACILHVPCITLRDNTERPETIEVGASILAGSDEQRLLEGAREMLDRSKNWPIPFGDGSSSRKIADIILKQN